MWYHLNAHCIISLMADPVRLSLLYQSSQSKGRTHWFIKIEIMLLIVLISVVLFFAQSFVFFFTSPSWINITVRLLFKMVYYYYFMHPIFSEWPYIHNIHTVNNVCSWSRRWPNVIMSELARENKYMQILYVSVRTEQRTIMCIFLKYYTSIYDTHICVMFYMIYFI